jgi:hypothetical protein
MPFRVECDVSSRPSRPTHDGEEGPKDLQQRDDEEPVEQAQRRVHAVEP